MKRFTVLMFSMLLIFSIALSACGKSADTSATSGSTIAPTTEPTATATAEPTAAATAGTNDTKFELRVSSWLPEEQMSPYFKAVEEKFKAKYPNATVVIEYTPGDKYFDKLDAQLASSAAADIFMNQKVPQYMKAGYAVDLMDQPWVADLSDAAKSVDSYDGKLGGLPLDISANGIMYNKKIFADLGLTPPKTYADFLKICDTILAKGIAPIQGAFKDSWTGGIGFYGINTLAEFAKNPSFEEDLFHGKVKLTGPEMADSFKKIQVWAEKGYFSKDSLTANYDAAKQGFASGKSAMIMNGTWVPADIFSGISKDFDAGFFTLPDDQGNTLISVQPDKRASVNAKSKNLQAAKDFLALMIDKDTYPLYLKAQGSFTPFKNIDVDYDLAFTKEFAVLLKTAQSHATTGSYLPGSVFNDICNEFAKIVSGAKFNESDLDAFQKDYDKDKSQIVNLK